MGWTIRSLSYSKTPRSRFLDLPAEIRDLIYESVLTIEKPVVAFRLDDYQRDSYQEATQPSLTRVNRQVRKESLPVFYRCNSIVLHTDSSKARDTHHWLQCIEANLTQLHAISPWIRYVTLTNEPGASNGAISIFLTRSKTRDVWEVADDWKWITVTRQPSVAESDAKLLKAEFKKIVGEDVSCVESADGIVAMMTDLKAMYVKEKMSY